MKPVPKTRLITSLCHYGTAIVSVCVATVLTRFMAEIGDSGITPLFFAAVFVSAWYGGWGAGLMATVLSGLATAHFLMPPANSFAVARDDLLRAAVFILVAMLTSSLHSATKRAAVASRKAEEQARLAQEAAEAASAAKTQFLAMVSHELRTPLNPVIMVSELLERDSQLPAQVRQDIAMIRRNVDLEVRLIDDLLDLSRVSNGKLRLNLRPVDLRKPLSAAVRVLEADVREKQLQLEVQQPREELPMIGDPLRLQQVFWNLLRNAIKFTPEKGRISLRGWSEAGQGVVELLDTGIGIEPERLSVIFHAFEQGSPDIAARFGGLGLGLAISQALIQAHGGTITAASDGKGCGATFTARLPLTVARIGEAESHGAAMVSRG